MFQLIFRVTFTVRGAEYLLLKMLSLNNWLSCDFLWRHLINKRTPHYGICLASIFWDRTIVYSYGCIMIDVKNIMSPHMSLFFKTMSIGFRFHFWFDLMFPILRWELSFKHFLGIRLKKLDVREENWSVSRRGPLCFIKINRRID